MKLIDKDTVLAEIEKVYNEEIDTYTRYILDMLKSNIDKLEVKDVDLEKEIDNYISSNFFGSQTLGFFANRTKEEPNDIDMALCAKHFFELGFKAQKGE